MQLRRLEAVRCMSVGFAALGSSSASIRPRIRCTTGSRK